jgi:hypothetical protein
MAGQPVDTSVRRRISEMETPANDNEAKLAPITVPDLQQASEQFETRVEKPGGFYDMARGLLQKGCEIEGCVLILATWNFPRFKWVVSSFDADALRGSLKELRDDFAALEDCSIQKIDLAEHRSRIEKIFNRLAEIEGVEYTGTPKLMQLECPELFVPWDAYIRGEKLDTFYDKLPLVKENKWLLHKYDKSGAGYVTFLSDMQNRFRELVYPTGSKTLAKAIDEFNFVNVTLPLQQMEDEEAFTTARDVILNILPRSRADAKKLREVAKSATVNEKMAKRALEFLVKDGRVEVVTGKQKGDTMRYCLSDGSSTDNVGTR